MHAWPLYPSRLRSDDDFRAFIALQKRLTGLHTPFEHLQRNAVIALRNRRRHIVGGFVVGYKAPFRFLEVAVPQQDREGLVAKLGEDRFIELCGAILLPEYRSSLVSFYYWAIVLAAAILQERPLIVGGTVEPKIKAYYEKVNPTLVYTATIIYENSEKTAWIFSWTKKQLFFGVTRAMLGRAYELSAIRFKQAT